MTRLLLLLGLGCLLGHARLARAADPNPPARKSVVILGDSLAAGYGVDPGESFPALLEQRVAQAGLPYTVINAGVSGDTTAGGLRRLDWLLKRPVDVLVLELGGNDGLRGLSLAQTRSNLVAIIHKARAKNPATEVVLAGMQIPTNMGPDYAGGFRAMFPELAKSEHARLIPFLLEGVGGIAELNQADQIHPTPKGHAIVASNVWVVLEPMLRKATVP
ncbi:MAG TPA: arylesterase [Candidatus Limnocylindria bacterium]|nr:arylesterase [Candidatus Limnocylindria bacterium]